MTTTDTMTAASTALTRPRRQWGKALKALRRLLVDKDDTGQVFEIMRALNGDANAQNYDRLLSTVEGGRVAYERVELAPKLMDQTWLASFAPGTVGAAYRDFVRNENLSADGLVEISRASAPKVDIAHPHAWFGRRTRDVHDVWHILSGYHRDGLGEACLVAFTYAQTGALGWAAIALGVALRARRDKSQPRAAAIWQGYRRGKAAKWLSGEDYLTLMHEPLDAARKRLNIAPATIYDSIPAAFRDGPIANDNAAERKRINA